MTGQERPLRPLRDDTDHDTPELELGARLLHRVGPMPRSELRKRRVWQALGTGGNTRSGARRRALRLALTGVLFAAASSAAVGHYYVEQLRPQPIAAPPPVSSPELTAPPQRLLPRPPSIASHSAEAEAPEPVPKAPARSRPEGARPPKATANEAEAQLLVEAMRARRAGDAARVSKLADEYRARHPEGALQEEALILALESAVARRAPNRATLAREYLSRFPQGRFVAQAKRALPDRAP